MYHNQQLQIQDYSLLQKQKQDLVHCNNSFGMLLSSMESLFIKSGYNIKINFGYYNHFNVESWKTKEEIKAQIFTDLMAYKIQKLAYTQKYGKFDFPDNPPIEEIIQIVKTWETKARDAQEKSLCKEILDLINDKNLKPISYYQGRVENVKSSSKADPIESVKMSNEINNKIDERNKKINSQIENNPNAKFGLKMGEKKENSEFSDIKINKNKKKDTKLSDKEKNIINHFEDLLKSVNEFFIPKEIKKSGIEEKIKKVSKDIDDYYKENKNIEFIFCKIHKENTNKELNEKIKKYDEYIKLLKNIKKMINDYDLI